jgi:hypothetical protein
MAMSTLFSACFEKDDDGSSSWAKANMDWLEDQMKLKDDDGNDFYEAIIAPWDESALILMHWFNDTNLTRNNLKPLYTSMVDVKYYGRYYNNEPLDSSYARTSPADSIFRTRLNSGIIAGWALAITNMHIGDSVRVVIPYNMGYGTTAYGAIKGYTNLEFDLKLVGIPFYEVKP